MTTESTIPMPQDIAAEQIVLGCMLNCADFLQSGIECLDDSAFSAPNHKIIFRIMKSFCEMNNSCVSSPLFIKELHKQGQLNEVGGVDYLMDLQTNASTAGIDFEAYVEILLEEKKRRQLLFATAAVQQDYKQGAAADKIIEKLENTLDSIKKSAAHKDKFPIRFLNQFEANFLLTVPPPKPMLLQSSDGIGFLPKGIAAMLVGAGGIGKTHLLAQLAIAIASGNPFLETYQTTEFCGEDFKGNVFIGLGENQYDDLHRVLYKAAKELRNTTPDLLKNDPLEDASKRIAAFSFSGQQAAFIEDKKPSKYFRQLKMKLKETAPKGGWSLIILDPVSRLLGADAEKDNAAATMFISLLEELTIDLPGNPTVLFAHHVNKASMNASDPDQSAARGSSALTDGVRWQANFQKKEKAIILEMTKSNFTKIIEPIYLERDFDGYLRKSKLADPKLNAKEITTALNKKPTGHNYK